MKKLIIVLSLVFTALVGQSQTWSTVGTGTNGSVLNMEVFQSKLYFNDLMCLGTWDGASISTVYSFNPYSAFDLGSTNVGATNYIYSVGNNGSAGVKSSTTGNVGTWSTGGAGTYMGSSIIAGNSGRIYNFNNSASGSISSLVPPASSFSLVTTAWLTTLVSNSAKLGPNGHLWTCGYYDDGITKYGMMDINGVGVSAVPAGSGMVTSTADALYDFCYNSATEIYAGNVNGLRKWNGSTWSTIHSGWVTRCAIYNGRVFFVRHSATIDSLIVYTPATQAQVFLATVSTSVINDLKVFNGELYLGGNFTSINTASAGSISVNHLVRLNLPVASFTPNVSPICDNDTLVLTNTSTNTSSYVWYKNGVQLSTNPNESIIMTSIYPASTGTMNVSLVAIKGLFRDSTTFTVSVNAAPLAPIVVASGPTAFCSGGSVGLSVSTAGSNLYQWNTTAIASNIVVSSAGSYYVIAYSPANCVSDTSLIVAVTVNPNPSVPTITHGSLTFCSGGSVNLVSSSAYSYVWSNGATAQSVTAIASGSYTLSVANSFGCVSPYAAVTVNVTATPAAPVITASGPTTFCTGGSVGLMSNSTTGNAWFPGGSSAASISATAAGNYYVINTQNGCASAPSNTINVVVNSASANITASGPTTFCAGGDVALTANIGASYMWSNGSTNQSITSLTTGSYTVTVTAANGCSAYDVENVVVNALPVPVIAQVSTDLTTGSFSTYQWYKDGAMVNGANSQVYTPVASGNYTVEVSNASGCFGTSTGLFFNFVSTVGIVEEHVDNYSMKVADGSIAVNFEKPMLLQVYTVLGQLVYSNTSDFHVVSVESGVYIIKSELFTKKVAF